MTKNTLQAAVTQIDITPELPISMAGSLTRREATSIQSNLFARFLMLANEETTLLFVLVDVVGLSNEDMAKIRDTISQHLSLPIANICIACTHTHSAPATMDAFTYHREDAYVDALIDKICNTALDLPKKLQPASVAWGTGYEDRPAYNRRFIMQDGTLKTNPGKGNPAIVRPAGPTDPHFPFLAVRDANHNLLSVLASYSLHYLGADSSTAISADYFGEFSRLMQERHGPQCVAMLAHGASGDINNINAQELPEPWFEHATNPSEKCTVVAGMLVEQVEKLLPSLQFTSDVVMSSSENQVPHGVRKMNGEEHEATLLELKDGDPTAQIFAQERLHVQGYPDSIALPQQCWKVGGWAMCTFPGQMFAQYGLDLQYASPFETTTLVELANAWGGYVGRPMDYVLGGYEMKLARSSFATADTGPKLMESAVGQLQRLIKIE
jgi:neutral ceramidase